MCVCVETAALWGVSSVVNRGLLSIFSLKPSPFPFYAPLCDPRSVLQAFPYQSRERQRWLTQIERQREFVLNSCMHLVYEFTSREIMYERKCRLKVFAGPLP